MLGWLKLKSWLRAVLIVDMAGKDEVPRNWRHSHFSEPSSSS